MTIETGASPFQFAISATFTAEPLQSVIAFWGAQLSAQFKARFAPYNQIAQTLLNPASEFSLNTHGVNIILARLEDLGQFDKGSAGAMQRLEQNVHALSEQIRDAAPALNVPLIFCLCPSSPEFAASPDGQALEKRVAAFLEAVAAETPGVQFLHYEQVDRWYPVARRHDAEAERLARIPYSELYFAALGTALVRYTHAFFLAPFKVVALDCDNTLWKGICGEDGTEAVEIDPPRHHLQAFMVEQRDAGMLLTMASKNNQDDVLDTFKAHPDMPLSLRHFVSWRLNWEPKAENLISLSEELSLGLDSFIFVDDNPKECAEVEGALPQVLTLALPEDIQRVPEFLRHVWAFDHPVVTEEDRNRNVYYAQQQEFGAEVRRAASLEEFMAALDLRVTIEPVTPQKLTRTAQLTQRTNQFNLTTIRRTEAEIQVLGNGVLSVEVSDRFGDYGQVGVIIVNSEDDALLVDTFLLSCRVLGRGVEHKVAAYLGEMAASKGLNSVVFRYEPTAKNSPALEFLQLIGAANGIRLPATELAGLRWSAPIGSQKAPKRTKNANKTLRKAVDYARIALKFSTAGAILQAMRTAAHNIVSAGSMTETESTLVRIWAELLQRPSVEKDDNFFDLGGHSLLAVLLLLRIREAFDVELSIDDVYSGTLTLSDLATRIETAQLGGIDPAEYGALVAQIEAMSDDEVRRLLEAEDFAR